MGRESENQSKSPDANSQTTSTKSHSTDFLEGAAAVYLRASTYLDDMRDKEQRLLVEAKELHRWEQAGVHCERQLVMVSTQLALNQILDELTAGFDYGNRTDSTG